MKQNQRRIFRTSVRAGARRDSQSCVFTLGWRWDLSAGGRHLDSRRYPAFPPLRELSPPLRSSCDPVAIFVSAVHK